MDPRHRARVQVPQKNWYFIVGEEDMHRLNAEALLDVLRYDGATPLSGPPAGYMLFHSRDFPTTARWTSFGVTILTVSRDLEDSIRQLQALK